jgi:2-iminobutanoate/2-iminopropanoate deaminase
MARSFTFALGLIAGLTAAGLGAQAGVARKVINLPNRPIQAPFSDGVLAGDTLYLAGRLGLDATGQPPKEAADEARLVLDGVRAALAAGGLTMDDLVSVQVFCPDLSLYDAFNGVYRTYFKGDPPARAFIGSGALLRGARFEVQGIAVKR